MHSVNRLPGTVRPYENLEAYRSYTSEQFYEDLNELLTDGFVREGCALSLQLPIQWEGHPRTFAFRVHSWDPIGDLLAAHSALGRMDCLHLAETIIFDWLREFHEPVAGRDPEEVVARAAAGGKESFVWYDMAVGLRIYRLAYFAEVIIRSGSRTAAERQQLVDALHFHHRVLALPGLFRGHTNHGLYQALGQLAAARRLRDVLDAAPYEELARQRLSECVPRQFLVQDGVHAEHSPSYHHMVVGTLLGAREAGLLTAEIDGLLLRAEEALMWMVRPDATLAPIGDSDRWPLHQISGVAGKYRSPALRYFITGGETGEPPPCGVRGYKEAGYAFARIYDRAGGADPSTASYLAQLSAYHSRVHKHADHLGFVWSEGNVEILTDSGRYGYHGRTTRGDGLYEQGFWYSDPARVYVESTRAHNCVEVDRRSYPRLQTAIFGSGLKQVELQEGLVVFDSSIVLRPSLLWRRTLVLRPGEYLIVIDVLLDRSGTPHDFDQWFQLAHGWSAGQTAEGYVATRDGMTLHVVDLLRESTTAKVAVGEPDPLQGWTSLQPGVLTPSPSIRFSSSRQERAAFATLFSLNGEPKPEPITRTNRSLSRAILAWKVDNKRIRIDLERGEELTVKEKTSDVAN